MKKNIDFTIPLLSALFIFAILINSPGCYSGINPEESGLPIRYGAPMPTDKDDTPTPPATPGYVIDIPEESPKLRLEIALE